MHPEDAGIEGVTIRRVARLPGALPGGTRVGPYSSACPGMLLRVVPGVGRFLASGGTRLDYAVETGADPSTVAALIEGGVMGALIHQRGELPLHATTLVSRDGAFALALAGSSGAGKSTTAYALVRLGWTLLADDLSRVTVDEGRPTAWPGRSRLRLMEDACGRFGIDTGALRPAPNWPGKFILDLARAEAPVPLAGLVVLERGEGRLRVERLRGAAAARALAEQTYRRHYVAALGQARRHLELVAATAARTAVVRLRGCGSVEEVAAALDEAPL